MIFKIGIKNQRENSDLKIFLIVFSRLKASRYETVNQKKAPVTCIIQKGHDFCANVYNQTIKDKSDTKFVIAKLNNG